jgi:hypothetical protein
MLKGTVFLSIRKEDEPLNRRESNRSAAGMPGALRTNKEVFKYGKSETCRS